MIILGFVAIVLFLVFVAWCGITSPDKQGRADQDKRYKEAQERNKIWR